MSAFTHGRSGSADGRDAVALATRGASLDARGSGARSAGLLAALLAALLLASLFAIATSAQGATVGSRVQLGTFCTETGETGGRCGAARGVAVNRSGVGGVDPGTVYIANFLNRRIEQFSEGEFVRAFGWDVVASGENDVGVGFEICEADSDPVDVCKQGLQVPDPGAISNTEDVVVDPQTGNVLVADNGGAAGKRISVYSATGEFQAAFGIGVQTGAPSLELCTATTGCQAGTASVAAGGLSNLLKAALAVDPVSGNLFVGERGTRRVSEFSFTLNGLDEVTGVAFERAFGWDVVPGGGSELETCTTLTTCQAGTAGGGAGQFPTNTPVGLAVDGSGFVYAVTAEGTCNATTNPCRVQKFSPDGTITPENVTWGPDSGGAAECQINWTSGFNRGQGPEGIAIDPVTGAVYVTRKASETGAGNNSATFELCEFDSAGTLVDRSPVVPLPSTSQGYLEPAAGPGGAVYVNVLRGTGNLSSIVALGTPPAPPEAIILPPTNLTPSSATLNGEVTIPAPGGFGYETTYHFELSSDLGFSWESRPLPDASAGSLAGDVPVALALDDLLPNQKYQVKLVATNAADSDTSDVLNFETPPAPPTIANTRALPVSDTAATLRASVNPNSSTTLYRFEWGTTTAYGNQSPDFEPLAGEGAVAVPVAASIGALTPGTTYHFRLVATNAAGTTYGPDVAFTTNACPQFGANGLPSCRALELVSPGDQGPVAESTEGQFVGEGELQFQASEDGDSLAYTITRGLPDSTTGAEVVYRADRDHDSGWGSVQLSAPSSGPSVNPDGTAYSGQVRYMSRDLSCGFLASREALTTDVPPITLERGETSLFSVDADGSHTLITSLPAVNPSQAAGTLSYQVVGASEDCSRVIFISPNQYPGLDFSGDVGLGLPGLYEWHDGVLVTLGMVPGPSGPVTAQPAQAGAVSGTSNRQIFMHAVSTDARRVYFNADSEVGPDAGNRALFLSEEGAPGVNVSASETATPTRGVYFQTASHDGSRVFFLANSGLTSQPSNGPKNMNCSSVLLTFSQFRCDLYEYDAEGEDLRNLTATDDNANPEGAVVAGVLDASADGSHVYFAAQGQLVPKRGRTYAENVGEGTFNVYLAIDGAETRFVGVVRSGELPAGPDGPGLLIAPRASLAMKTWSSRATPDGEHFVFQTAANVTGYESGGVFEAYRYSAASDTTLCVSCPAGGGPTVGTSSTRPLAGRSSAEGLADVHFPRRSLSADGSRVFFRVPDVLAPGAIEGASNLYQWEQGHVTLLATYPGPEGKQKVEFMGASADGDSVFFTTPEKLLPADLDNRKSVYVARVGGGFAPPPPPPTPCDPLSEGSCAGPASPGPPPGAPAGSATFQGEGNLNGQQSTRCNRNQVRRGNRCVAKRALAKRACAKRKGKAKRRCVRNQVRRLNRVQARQLRATNINRRAGK